MITLRRIAAHPGGWDTERVVLFVLRKAPSRVTQKGIIGVRSDFIMTRLVICPDSSKSP
jgi:hypothetical protein